MADNEFVGGVKHVYWNGTELRCKEEGIRYCLDTHEREVVLGVGGAIGAKRKRKVQFIEVSLVDTGDLDTLAIFQQRGTITLHLENGKTIGLNKALFTGSAEVDAESGEIPGRWEGTDAFEVV